MDHTGCLFRNAEFGLFYKLLNLVQLSLVHSTRPKPNRTPPCSSSKWNWEQKQARILVLPEKRTTEHPPLSPLPEPGNQHEDQKLPHYPSRRALTKGRGWRRRSVGLWSRATPVDLFLHPEKMRVWALSPLGSLERFKRLYLAFQGHPCLPGGSVGH